MRKRLRIYLPFAANELKRQLAYKGAFYLFILVHLFGSFISYYLWMAIYGSSEEAVIGGLTQSEMVVYVFMVYVTASIVTASVSTIVSDDVVKGTVGLEFYKIKVLGLAPVTIAGIFLYLTSCLMSFLISVLFDFCFGMLAFFTTYIFGMRMAKEALLSFLTGQLIPISFFPAAMQRVFDFLPFSSMVYTPVMIYLGKYTGETLVFMMLRQAAWVVLLYVAGSLIWRQVTKRLVVLGG